MSKHHDSGELATLDQTLTALADLADKLGVTAQLHTHLGPAQTDELAAATRRHTRRQARPTH